MGERTIYLLNKDRRELCRTALSRLDHGLVDLERIRAEIASNPDLAKAAKYLAKAVEHAREGCDQIGTKFGFEVGLDGNEG
jgi:hypothetical protein